MKTRVNTKLNRKLWMAVAAAVFGSTSAHLARANGPTIHNVDWILNGSGNWTDAGANWSGGLIPTNTSTNVYNVSLDLTDGGPYTVTLPYNVGTYNVNGVTITNANATLLLDQNSTLDLTQPDNGSAPGNLSIQNGIFNLNGGTLADAAVQVGVNGSFQFNSGMFQNVTLQSDITINTYNQPLYVINTTGNAIGLNTSANGISLAGSYNQLYFNSAYNNKFNLYVPDVFQGTANLTGANASIGSNSLWDLTGTINSISTNNSNQISGNALTINTGTINAGSASVTGNTLTIGGGPFDNAAGGTMTVFNGNTLQVGGSYSSSGYTTTNEGIIQTATAQQGLSAGGSATLDMNGHWSNTGTIRAAAGDTVNMGGYFNPVDVGLAGGIGQGTFNPNGATVNLVGAMDLQNGSATFSASTGLWNFNGTIQNGTLRAQDSSGNQYLNIASGSTGTLQTVTLGSNLTIGGGTLNINNTTTDLIGLHADGYVLTLAGGNLNFNDADLYSSFGYLPQTYHGTINVTDTSSINFDAGAATLSGVLNVIGAGSSGAYASLNGFDAGTESGSVNIGSATSTGNTLSIQDGPFANSGTITIFNGNTLAVGNGYYYNGTFINSGTIESIAASQGLSTGGSATINLYGSWSNTGSILAAGGDTINLGGIFSAADVGLAASAGEGVFSSSGATVNLTGTMNLGSGQAAFKPTDGIWNFSGIIENGTLSARDSGGTQHLLIPQSTNATLQNVTLGSNFTVANDNAGLTVSNTQSDTTGLNLNGYAIHVSGQNAHIAFQDASVYNGLSYLDIGQTLNNGQIILGGINAALQLPYNGTLTLGSGATVSSQAFGTSTAAAVDNIANGTLLNAGNIQAGSASVLFNTLNISTDNFTNQTAGNVVAFNGDTIAIQAGTWNNAGTIDTYQASQGLTTGGSATITLGGTWNNTGSIRAAAGDTVNLGGTFHAADIAMANDGAANSNFSPNGATVNITGTLINSDLVGGTSTPNALYFSGPGTSTADHATSTGIWNLGASGSYSSGNIQGGTVAAQDTSGNEWLNIIRGTMTNVTLASDLSLVNASSTLSASNTASNAAGLTLAGHAINLMGQSSSLSFTDAQNAGVDIGQAVDSGTINLSGSQASISSAGSLTIAPTATINSLASGATGNSSLYLNSNTVDVATLVNQGQINIGSAAVGTNSLYIYGNSFTNATGGSITIFGGDTLQLDSTAAYGSNNTPLFNNAAGARIQTIDGTAGGATLNFSSNWSNSGSITTSASDTVNLGGSFHAADVAMANNGAANGTFASNGATVNIVGTLINASGGSSSSYNTLYFAGAGTSTPSHSTSNGLWSLGSSATYQPGTIQGGTLVAQDASGRQWLNVYFGTLQNVSLGSNLNLFPSDSSYFQSLTIMNTSTNPAGLTMNGHSISVGGYRGSITYSDATDSAGNDIGQTIDSGAVNLTGNHSTLTTSANGTLSIGKNATINALASAGYNSESFLSGNSILNYGNINIGSKVVIGTQLFINATNFTNETGGVITVYSGNNLIMEATNWINDGVIQTSDAAGLGTAGGASLTFKFAGSAINTGTINATGADVVNFGSGGAPGGSGSINSGGALLTGIANSGTINVGSATTTGETLFINPDTFSNSGHISVYTGNSLVLGDTDPSTVVHNFGIIETSSAAGIGNSGGATISMSGNWSNSGSILAAAGDTVNLGGTFSAADVSLAASGPQGIFTPGGANVNLYGNLEQQTGSTFNLAGGALTVEANGSFTMDSGATLANATVNLDSNGNFGVADGASITFQNVALGSIAFPNIQTGAGGAKTGLLTTNNITLNIVNSPGNPVGFSMNGLPLIIQGSGDTLNFHDSRVGGNDVSQTFSATAFLEGANSLLTTNGTLTFAGSLNEVILNGSNGAGEDYISGNSVINTGTLNVGSNAIGKNILVINSNSFTNAASGVITVYNADILDIAAQNWSNAGTIQTAASIGDAPTSGTGAILEFGGSWTNTGTISLTKYDEVVFGSNPISNTGTIGSAGQVINAVNTGTIDVGSASTTGLFTLISPTNFTNGTAGAIEVFNGNSLLLGDPYGYQTTWSNAGTIESATAAGAQTGGGAKIQFKGNWSNTGRVLAAAGDTVKLGGSFTAADLGLTSGGGGTFSPNGANVDLSGFMNLEGNTATIPSLFYFDGTIANGTLASGTDSSGNEYLFIGSGSSATFQNVTLGSNYNVAGSGATLNVNNTLANAVGLDLGGNTLTLSGQKTTLQINNTLSNPNTLQDGTLTLSGVGAQLNTQNQMTLGATLIVNSTSTGGNGNFISGFGVVNAGHINVGYDSSSGTTVTGNALAIYAGFTNVGTVTVYGGNNLFVGEPANLSNTGNPAGNWSNSGTIQSNDNSGGTSGITLQGNWSNTGRITANPGDLVTLSGTFHAADIAMANDGATNATFTTNGATVNITGTLINSDLAGGTSTPNSLYFGGPGTSTAGHATSQATWNLGDAGGDTGTIQGGTLYAQDSHGIQWLNIYNGALENVTLASNVELNNSSSSLQILSSSGGQPGLTLAGNALNATADYATISDNAFIDTLDNGTVNLAGASTALNGSNAGLLTLGANLLINVTDSAYIGGGSVTNLGQINVNSTSSSTPGALTINSGGFHNEGSGIITVYGGNSLIVDGTLSNAATASIVTQDSANTSATLTFQNNWSNAGTIRLASGDTINLGGVFHPADVAMANDGATNGTFTTNGATVSITGTLINSDIVGPAAAPNILNFAGPGTSSNSTFTSNGVWNLGSNSQFSSAGGTIQGGTVVVQDSAGNQWLNIAQGTLENVSLGSNLNLTINNGSLTIQNTTANAEGLLLNGYTINDSGNDTHIYYQDASDSAGNDVSQTLDNGTINFIGTGSGIGTTGYSYGGSAQLLTIGSQATINALAPSAYSYGGTTIGGDQLVNLGKLNAGSAAASGAYLTISATSFTNQSGGVLSVFSGSILDLSSSSWTNLGTITGSSGGTINLGGTFHPVDVAMATDVAHTSAVFNPNGATVNLTGTLINADAGATTPNTLTFNAADTWTINSGTIQGGIVVAQDAIGNQYLNIGSDGTLQNVTLGSNFAVGGNGYATLDIQNSTTDPNGIILSGYTLNVSNSGSVDFTDATDNSGNNIGQTLANGTVAITGNNASINGAYLAIAATANITASGSYDTLQGAAISNSGKISVGSAAVTGASLAVQATTFTNQAGGIITAFGGNSLTVGSQYFTGVFTNAAGAVITTSDTGTGVTTLIFAGIWSNAGTISANMGDTVNLGGTFHPVDVAMATDIATGSAQGTFTPGGATVNLTGTLINVDGTSAGNTLTFDFAHEWNFAGGTIQGGTVIAQSGGNQYLNLTGSYSSGTFRNVTLGSNYSTGTAYDTTLTIANSQGNSLGLNPAGYAINMDGNSSNLVFSDAANSSNQDIQQIFDHGSINFNNQNDSISGSNNTLVLGADAVVNSLGTSAYGSTDSINGGTVVNTGNINVGSNSVTGNLLTISPTTFTNALPSGTLTGFHGITVYSGNTLAVAGQWTNTGDILAMSASTVNLGGTFNPASVGLANDGATNGSLIASGATVNITGTLNNSDTISGVSVPNTLDFAAANVGGLNTSQGIWFLSGGTITGGKLSAQDNSGTEYLVINSGTLANVTLISNLLLNGSTNTLNIDNSSGSPVGMNTDGHDITLAGNNFTLQYNNALGIYPNYFNQTLADHLNISGPNDTLTVNQGLLTLNSVINSYGIGNFTQDNLSGSALLNNGSINGGVNNAGTPVSGNTLVIDPGIFTNNGTVTAFGGLTQNNAIQFGNGNNSTAWSNAAGATITSNDSAGGNVTLTFLDHWSNNGSITAATGDTINLGGLFHPADVGMANDGAKNGSFAADGATINLTGTLVNTDPGFTTQNTLAFTAANPWTFAGGTISGGTVNAQSAGVQYLNIAHGSSGTFQNVTLASDFAVTSSNGSLFVANSAANPAGLLTNGHTLTFSGNSSGMNVSDYRNPETGIQTGQTFTDSIYLTGANAYINGPAGTVATLATTGSISGLASNSTNNMTVTELINHGVISAGSNIITGNTTNLNSAVFTNTGSVHVYAGNTLNLSVDPNSTWTNSGNITIGSGAQFTAQNADNSPLEVILASGSTIDIQIGSNGTSGLFKIPNGTLTIDSNVTLNISLAPGAVAQGPYTLFNFTGLATGTFANVISYFGQPQYENGSIVITGTPTPEPASLAILVLGGLGLLTRNRRRKSAAA